MAATRPAAFEADLVKGQGSHVLALGVGAAVTKPASAQRLTAVSGFDQYPPEPPSRGRLHPGQGLRRPGQALRDIATELCQASVTVTKLVDEGDGAYPPDAGWRFTARCRRVQAATPGCCRPRRHRLGPRSETTNNDGVATFQWKPTNVSATSTVTLDEMREPRVRVREHHLRDERARPDGAGAPCARRSRAVQASRSDRTSSPNARCATAIRPGTIEIEKSANPRALSEFHFAGSALLGDFTLVDDGKDDPAVHEDVHRPHAGDVHRPRAACPSDWELSGARLHTRASGRRSPGRRRRSRSAPGGSVVCTYRDTRIDPPVPPEPPIPPIPPTPPTVRPTPRR